MERGAAAQRLEFTWKGAVAQQPEFTWKGQVAKALGTPFQHQKPPIPEAIVQLLKPIYAHLGSRVL